MKRKRITLSTLSGQIVTDEYRTLSGAIRGTGVDNLNAVKIEPIPFCGVGPCDDCAGCDLVREQAL